MSNLRTLLKQSELHASRREWSSARTSLLAALAIEPGHAGVLLQLSYIESFAGHYRKARQYAAASATALPRDPEVLLELLPRLRTFNEASMIHACLSRLGSPREMPIPLLITAAAQLSYLNQQERALLYLDEARAADPAYPPTLLARGQILSYLGRFDEAESELQRCIARAPELAQAHWFLSRLRTQTPEHNNVDRLRKQLARVGHGPENVALLSYALHKELDDLGDYAGAWVALDHACRAKRATLNYSPSATQELVSALMALPNPDSTRHAAPQQRTSIFIVGMHRSGTTLLEQLLDGHSDVHGIGELYDFTSQMRQATDHHCRGVIDSTIVERAQDVDFDAVGNGYLSGVEWRLGKEPFFTDKLPSNFLNIGFICQALPNAKILHMVRDPMETCFSNLRELFSDANPYSYDQIELAAYFNEYRRLMAHWHAAFPGRILDVDYASLTRDPESVMRDVVSFCGMQYQAGMLDLQHRKRGVATASAVQVRKKVAVRDQPKWIPYQERLRPLMQALPSI